MFFSFADHSNRFGDFIVYMLNFNGINIYVYACHLIVFSWLYEKSCVLLIFKVNLFNLSHTERCFNSLFMISRNVVELLYLKNLLVYQQIIDI